MVVAMLTEDDHAGRLYKATGPSPVSFADAIDALAESTGQRIHYVRVSNERYAALLAGQDVRQELVVRLMQVIDKLLDNPGGWRRCAEGRAVDGQEVAPHRRDPVE
jgi:uncharacterized protein YbjT (DUF2867 family)